VSSDIGTGPGQGNNAFGRSRNPSGLTVWSRDNSLQPMGVSRSPAGLDLYALNPNVNTKGWAVYTFKRDGSFTVTPGANVLADVLLVGGGGSGGGGIYGGGGGAGGFLDKHEVIIYHDGNGPPHGGGYPDGEVVVGVGGAAVPITESPGHAGEDSSLGSQLVAYGGGYGGRRTASEDDDYSAGDGASGGGGRGNEIYLRTVPDQIDLYTGIPGLATHNEAAPEGGDARDYEQGHDGGPGGDSRAWYNHSCGGGGGAAWPAFDGFYSTGDTRMSGGIGRPCDIGGWYQCPDPVLNAMYREAGWAYVPWFGGGGAGMERPNLWSYPDGHPGYGGGGGVGMDGTTNTGGGGGGYGWYGEETPPGQESGKAPGRAGGSGIVVVRIPLSYKQYVTAPLQLTDGEGQPSFTQVWDQYDRVWVAVPVYPSGVTYAEVPLSEPHTDHLGGMEPVLLWGNPSGGHYHRWGWEDSDFENPYF